MYQLNIDKNELFECTIQVDGGSTKNSDCRLILESDDWAFLFQGRVDNSGNVTIPVNKLKSVLNEGDSGTLKLEVIVDGDTYFTPWEDKFQAKLSKKVVAEVRQRSVKNTRVQLSEIKKSNPLADELHRKLVRKGFTLDTISERKSELNKLILDWVLSKRGLSLNKSQYQNLISDVSRKFL